MSFSVFKDADIERLKKDADSAQKPLYYLIHPDESYPTGTKLSVFFSNLANKNFSGNEQTSSYKSSAECDRLRQAVRSS